MGKTEVLSKDVIVGSYPAYRQLSPRCYHSVLFISAKRTVVFQNHANPNVNLGGSHLI